MRIRIVAGVALLVAGLLGAIGAGVATASPATAGPTPPIHLQGAAFSASQARFQWVPGSQNHYFCLDYAKSPGDLFSRTGTWRNSGCGTATSVVVQKLSCGTTYYTRVWTSAGGGLYSSVLTIHTSSCASAISTPTNLNVIYTTRTSARLDWDPGKDNRWFCVDVARSQNDLLNYTGSWRNYDCWTTSSQVTVTGLQCGTIYYWRVYAWNAITNVHSAVSTFATDDCNTGEEIAPIEDVDVYKSGSNYYAMIKVGRPSSCYHFGSYDAEAIGNQIEITVYNEYENDSCTEVYSTYTLTLNLGSSFIPGVTYVVVVNDDESDIFTAS